MPTDTQPKDFSSTTSTDQPLVRVEAIAKRFGRREALKPLTLSIQRGEIFGLLGHNGAGKSTTFGIILGHVHADAGEVFIHGQSVQKNRAEALRHVGAIFETPSFYDYLSGWQNLEIFASFSGPVTRQEFEKVVHLVGLEKRIHDKVRTYSHGMRQRLAFAQALLPKPEFLLLDEPTEGLDPGGIRDVRDLILHLRAAEGLTILLSSHLLPEVEQLCDRVAILKQGDLVFLGAWKDAVPARRRFRVKTQDTATLKAAAAELNCLIDSEGMLLLPEDVDEAEILSQLVVRGVRVREFIRERVTLESFYLSCGT